MADSRHTPDKFIVEESKSFIQANIKELKEMATKVYVVPPANVKRLDLISYELYGTTELKWLLIYINDIIDLSDVVYGYQLKYVLFSDITRLLFETVEEI